MARNKTGGRKAGTPNKSTRDLRVWITDFIQKNTDKIEADFDKLEGKDRLIIFEKLLKYSLPQLQATNNTIDFDSMDEVTLDIIIERLKSAAQ